MLAFWLGYFMMVARSSVNEEIGVTSDGLVGAVEKSRCGRERRRLQIAALTGDGGAERLIAILSCNFSGSCLLRCQGHAL